MTRTHELALLVKQSQTCLMPLFQTDEKIWTVLIRGRGTDVREVNKLIQESAKHEAASNVADSFKQISV